MNTDRRSIVHLRLSVFYVCVEMDDRHSAYSQLFVVPKESNWQKSKHRSLLATQMIGYANKTVPLQSQLYGYLGLI